MDTRNCLECGAELRGRRDKKFCDSSCRSAHNNKSTSDTSPLVRKINRALARNRKVLEAKLEGPTTKAYRQDLEREGFNFNYYTHVYTTKTGKVYFYNYDHGYMEISDKMVLIVKDSFNS